MKQTATECHCLGLKDVQVSLHWLPSIIFLPIAILGTQTETHQVPQHSFSVSLIQNSPEISPSASTVCVCVSRKALCKFLGLVVQSINHLSHALNRLQGTLVGLVHWGFIKHDQNTRALVQDT